jgi:hypothetical protein
MINRSFIGVLVSLVAPLFISASSLKTVEINSLRQCLAEKVLVQGLFTQKKYLSILKQPVIISGEFQVRSLNELVWKQTDPIMVTYTVEDNQLYRSKDGYKREELSGFSEGPAQLLLSTMIAAMAGEFEQLNKQFNLSLQLQDCDWLIKLNPANDELRKFIDYIELSGNRYLKQMVIWELSGDKTQIELTITQEH